MILKIPNQLYTCACIALVMMTAACQKDETTTDTNTTTSDNGFFYAENGTATSIKADEAKANQQYKTIIATKNKQTVVEINLSDFKVGTYSLASKYAFTYVKDNNHWEATAGNLKISKNENGKISGTYDATAGAGVTGVTSVKGKFTDIEIK